MRALICTKSRASALHSLVRFPNSPAEHFSWIHKVAHDPKIISSHSSSFLKRFIIEILSIKSFSAEAFRFFSRRKIYNYCASSRIKVSSATGDFASSPHFSLSDLSQIVESNPVQHSTPQLFSFIAGFTGQLEA